jgi:hypothetical protein
MRSTPARTIAEVGALWSSSVEASATRTVLDTTWAFAATAAERRTPPATVTAVSALRVSRRDALLDAPGW